MTLKTVTYPVCECGQELRTPADGLILVGSVYRPSWVADPHEGPEFRVDSDDHGRAICRKCFHEAVGWPPSVSHRGA